MRRKRTKRENKREEKSYLTRCRVSFVISSRLWTGCCSIRNWMCCSWAIFSRVLLWFSKYLKKNTHRKWSACSPTILTIMLCFVASWAQNWPMGMGTNGTLRSHTRYPLLPTHSHNQWKINTRSGYSSSCCLLSISNIREQCQY